MRKRITSLFLVLALCLTLLPTTALAEEAGAAQETQDSTEVGDGYTIEEDTAVQTGTGAAATGEVCRISSAEDLEAFCKRVNGGESSLNAVLVKDVSRNKNTAWTSITGYTGVFDGNGHTITLRVGGSGENNALFGSIASGGTVQDLTVQIYDSRGYHSSETGSVAYSNAGTILRCHALSWLGDKKIGGIVYENESTGLVKDCRVGTLTLSKTGDNLVGGIAFVNNGLIQNCYVSGRLQSTYNGTRGDLSSSTAIVRTNNGTVENCYYLQYDGETAVAGTPVTDEAAFASGEVAYKLNGGKTELDSVWRQNLPGNKDGANADAFPVTDASHGRVYYDSGSYYSLVPHLHGTEELTAWQQTDSLPDTSGSYYLTGNVTLASVQTLSNDVTLCVNGHSVNGDVTVTGSFTLTNCGSGSVTGNVTVNGGGSFTLEDCALSGKIENSGMLTVSGGTVTASKGDAVTNHGTFTMNSGTITAASGTGVANNGTLTMNGGTVTGCDKGIEGSGDITVSGKVKISGNANGNLILPDGKTVSVGTLDSTANIGITAEKQGELTAGGSIRLTSGGAAYTTRFFADNAAAYAIFADGEDLVMRTLGEHTHCICGHPADGAGNIGDHTEHTNVTFQPWTSGNSLPTTGNYYLTQNVVVDKMTVLTGTLCLNGYTISAKDGGCPVEVSSGELNLTDCAAELGSVIAAEDKAIVVYSTANIFNGVIRGGSGAGIYIGPNSAGARVAIYGGKITGSGTGAAVNSGEIHMYGGEISQNSRGVQAGTYKGSGSGLFYLHDGKITDNHGDRGGGVYVEHNFYMDGGEVSNNSATGNGGGIYMNTGSIFLSGGKVTGNRAGGDGGGVCTKAYAAKDSKSYVDLSGNAEISGNHAGGRGGGVYLDVYSDSGTDYLGTANWCTLTMDGGSITGNTSVGDGGGVYAAAENKRDAKSYVNVKGNVQITGNKKGEEDNNLYLPNYSGGVTIRGNLDQTADIRVTTENKPSKNSTVTIAKKSWQVSSVTVPDGVFKVDGADGKISVDDKGNVTLAPCSHSWTMYTASGAVITAKCSICSASGGSVTINKPAHTTYGDGNEAAATVTGSIPGVTAPTITYKKGDESLTAAPTDAGTYTASITLGEGNKAATASVKYTIQRADPKASDFTFAAPSPLTYDGNAKTATVEPNTGINGMGAVTVKYFKNGAETEPKDAGDYTVKVSVAEGANYNATTDDLTTDDWKFTIGKATQTITVPTDKTIVKDGIAEDISDWATVAGVTGGSAPGTLSYTLDGSYTGVALKGNQLTVDSSVATGTTITIKVTAEETGNYNKEEQTFTVKVADKNTATVTITGLPDTVTYGQEFTLTASQTGDTTSANKKWTWDYDQEYFKLVGPNANTETITLQAIKAGTPSKGITATYESGTHKGSKTVTPGVAQKEVTVSGITAANKEYDGNTDATVNASGATITGIVSGDSLTITATGSFADADVGENKTVTLTLGTLGGADSANYTLATAGNQTETKANITAKDVSISAVTVSDKDYNGNANATVASVTITGVSGALSMGTDFDVTSATFPDADADTANVDVTINVALKGTAANNYNLTNGMGYVVTSAAKINKAAYSGSAPTKTVNILKNYAGVQTGTLTAADFFATAPAEAKITAAVPDSTSSSMMSIAGADSSGNFTYDSKTNITAASDESWTVTISSKNYTNITAMLTFSLVDRTNAGVTISGVPTSKIYGESFTLTASVTDAGTGTGSWTWTSNDPSVLQVTGTGASATVKALKAGSATISAKYESDTTMGEQTTAPITVGKRVITVTADNKSMTVNGTLPTFTVTYGNLPSGVQAADIFGTLASASTTTDGKTTGSFDITVTTPVLKTEAGANYEVGAVTKGTLTVNPRSSSGGGGGSSVSTYSVTVGKTENGSVSVSPKSASKGDTVTVTVTPDKGYTLETLTVLDKKGKELKLTEKNGKYTFTMPAGKVEVKATFMEDNSMLNFFYDVPNNAYFYEAVKWAVENGITTGVGNDLFAPEQPCTRAQIVTFLWRAAGSPEPKGAASGMTDVVSGSYYEKAVAWAIENGITTGTTTSTFSPDATCTRAQAVTFLARALKAKAASAAEFSDVPTGSYFADAVAWAAANGVTEGIGGGLFGSDNDCTRGQIVTFLYRAYNK